MTRVGSTTSGLMYERGYAVARSYATALELVSEGGGSELSRRPRSRWRGSMGSGLGVPRDVSQRNAWLLRAAGQDSPMAQYLLGNIYRLGLGVPQDLATAAQWYQRAAAHDFAPAQARLGLMYRAWPRREAGLRAIDAVAASRGRQGEPAGAERLGVLYRQGYGVKQDYAQAVRWFRSAAEKGNTLGELNLGVMYA